MALLSKPSVPSDVANVSFASLIDGDDALALINAVRAGGGDAQRAKETLLSTFEPIVAYFARKFAWSGVSIDDLIQEARLGVLQAVKSYDPKKGDLWYWVVLRVRWRCSREARSVVRRRQVALFDPTSEQAAAGEVHRSAEDDWIESLDAAAVAGALASLHQLVPGIVDDGTTSTNQRRLARTMAGHPATLAKVIQTAKRWEDEVTAELMAHDGGGLGSP